jgi:hypothetical protein
VISGRVFDTAAVEHTVTGKTIHARAVVAAAIQQGNMIVIPAPALVLGARRIPDPLRRQGLDALLRAPSVVVEDLGESVARSVADLLAAARPPSNDVTAGAVVLSARRRGWPVVTDREHELLALDAAIGIERLP